MVALRKESVDRNGLGFRYYRDDVPVALRKESVDRNDNGNAVAVSDLESLSVRRAWIEIANPGSTELTFPVALRKESVDRNTVGETMGKALAESLSVRRAWIEIQ